MAFLTNHNLNIHGTVQKIEACSVQVRKVRQIFAHARNEFPVVENKKLPFNWLLFFVVSETGKADSFAIELQKVEKGIGPCEL